MSRFLTRRARVLALGMGALIALSVVPGSAEEPRQVTVQSRLSTSEMRSLDAAVTRLPADRVVDAQGTVRDEDDIPETRYRAATTAVLRDPRITSPAVAPTQAARPTLVRPGFTEVVELRPDLERKAEAALASKTEIRSALADEQARMFVFPGLIRQTGSDGEPLNLKAFALTREKLRYDRETGQYVGSISVGLADIGPGAGVRELTAPEVVEVIGSGTADPSPFIVSKTSPPFENITIRVPTAPDGALLRIVTRFDREGIELRLPLQPVLKVSLDAGSIEGWGIGTSTVTVTAGGIDNPAGKIVNLTVDPFGYISPSSVKLDAAGEATALLRSESTGMVTVGGSMIGMPASEDRIQFSFPFRTLFASLLGALIGAAIRLIRPGSGPRPGIGALLLSALVGVVIWGAYAVGINLLPFTASVTVGSLLVAVISALGAYFGTGLLDGKARADPEAAAAD